MGSPTLTELWVDPSAGGDNRSGESEVQALRTLTAAWTKLPSSTSGAATGYRVNLLPGTYPCEPGPEADNCINYFAERHGTRERPFVLRAARGSGTVTLRGGLNLRDVAYLYLLDLALVGGGSLPTNSSGNSLLHLEGGEHILVRGPSSAPRASRSPPSPGRTARRRRPSRPLRSATSCPSRVRARPAERRAAPAPTELVTLEDGWLAFVGKGRLLIT